MGKDAAAQGIIDVMDMTDFERFVQRNYDMEGVSWDKIILFHSQDEFTALSTFESLFGDYFVTPEHSSDDTGSPMGDYLGQ